MDIPPRTIIREEEFEEQLRALIPEASQADEYTAAAEDVLSHTPENGLPASRDGLTWMLPMSPIRGRQISLFYSFDETTVLFVAIVSFDE